MVEQNAVREHRYRDGLDVLSEPARKVVNVEGIFAPIRDKVVDSARRAGREQKPELSVIAEVGDEGGRFTS